MKHEPNVKTVLRETKEICIVKNAPDISDDIFDISDMSDN